jgi:hypothetical protein
MATALLYKLRHLRGFSQPRSELSYPSLDLFALLFPQGWLRTAIRWTAIAAWRSGELMQAEATLEHTPTPFAAHPYFDREGHTLKLVKTDFNIKIKCQLAFSRLYQCRFRKKKGERSSRGFQQNNAENTSI